MVPIDPGRYKFIVDIAHQMRKALLPHLNKLEMKESIRVAHSGDTTFRLDVVAEDALENAVRELGNVAYYSEDRGLVKFAPEPVWLMVVDPIDGTRPLICGLEMGMISIALCRFSHEAKFEDIVAAVLVEIGHGDTYFAVRDQGVQIISDRGKQLRPSKVTELKKMFWSYDTVGRPARWLYHYLGPLLDVSGIEAGAFLFSNVTFSLTCILTGYLDAYVEVGGRILRDHPESETEFRAIGNGRVMGAFPYDLAAAHLILTEAGCPITDAYGQPLDKVPLMAENEGSILSCVAASNRALHAQLLEALSTAG